MREKYDLYKDSGIDWVGEIPDYREVGKIKYHFSNKKIIPGSSSSEYKRLSLTMQGVLARDKDDVNGLQPEDFDNYQLLGVNELVFKLIDLQNVSTSRVGLSPDEGLVSPAYIILHVDDMSPKYAEKYFFIMWYENIFNSLGGAGVRSSLNAKDLLDLFIPIPPYEEQEKIADYLDEKIDSIKKAILLKEEQIELLKEKRYSLTKHIVTKGLNSNVEMKDSGIERIGEIPKKWESKKLKHVSKCRDSERIPIDKGLRNDGEYPYRGAGSITDYIDQYIFDEDLILLGEDGAPFFDRTRDVAHYITGKCWINNHIHILEPLKNMDGHYLTYFLNSVDYGSYIDGTVLNKLTQGDMADINVLLPPLDEQVEIVEYLDRSIGSINSAISNIDKSIDLLKEYKISLISHVVTGKVKVF